MEIVYEDAEILIFSNKVRFQTGGGLVVFDDGSYVDISASKIENKGPGDIVIRNLPMWPPLNEIIKEHNVLPPFKNISVHGDKNNLIIRPSEDANNYVSIGGTDTFVQKCNVSLVNDTVYIETPVKEDHVFIDCGAVWVNGKRLPPRHEEDFGFIEIQCGSVDELVVNSNGQGDIICLVPIIDLKANIKGSTSFELLQLNNADVRVSGSGNLFVSEFKGDLCACISGSGGINILTGLINYADVATNGSGDVLIGGTVKSAKLSQSGSGNMMIAHVLEQYTATTCGSGSIRVLSCGEGQ